MRKHQHSYCLLFRAKLALIVLIILAIGFPTDGLARKRHRKKYRPWEVQISLASFYDNNILKYSRKYLDRFINREDEGRFHINTYDDLVLNGALQISRSFRFIRRYKSEISTELRQRIYTMNPIKNWFYWRISLRQYLPGRISLKLSYSFIPKFYVRHYRDEDWVNKYGYTPETFQPFEFSKDNYTVWVQKYIFNRTLLRFILGYMRYYHNKHFTEYDCHNVLYGFHIYQPVFSRGKINFGYRFTVSDAKGYDEPGEARDLSDDSDPSFEDDTFVGGFTYRFPPIFDRHNSLKVEARFQRRYYQTTHYPELDPIHAGREDKNIRIYLNYYLQLNKRLTLTLFYNWLQRDSDTSAEANRTFLSNEKDYRQQQVGLGIRYLFRR